MPVANAKIVALRETHDFTLHNDLPVRWGPRPQARTETDDEGRFSLTVRDAARYVVQVEAEGYAIAETAPIDVEPKRGHDGLELHLVAGGAIEGYVLAPKGESPAGRIVAVNRGDGRARTVRTGEDGFYRFERLTPGDWQVTTHHTEITPNSSTTSTRGGKLSEIPADCRVFDGSVTRFDVDLGGGRTGVDVRGRVSVNGAVPGSWRAELVEADELRTGLSVSERRGSGRSDALDSTGAFRLRAGGPGDWRVVLHSPSDDGLPLMLFGTLTLSDMPADVQLDLDAGSLRISDVAPLAADGSPMERTLDVLYWTRGEWTGMVALVSETGEARLPVVPAGRVRILRVPMHALDAGPPDPNAYPVVGEAMVRAGEESELSIE